MLEAFRKENKIIVRCITYWIFIIALTVVFVAHYRQTVEADLNQVRERYGSIAADCSAVIPASQWAFLRC